MEHLSSGFTLRDLNPFEFFDDRVIALDYNKAYGKGID